MDFGRVENIDITDFTLPADHPDTQQVLKEASSNKKPEVFVGLPIWGIKDWVGTLYPPKTKDKDFLAEYAKQFNSIEANSTGYIAPSASTIENWIKVTPERFRFCPKIPRKISQKLSNISGTEAFCESMRILGNRLGTCFLQFPDSFGPKRINELISFIESWPKDIPLAIELRHEEWFSNSKTFDEVFNAMRENNISSIITDVAGRRDALHQRLTTSIAFIRFNGYDLHPQDKPRIDTWIEKLKTWTDLGLKNIYFFVHTDDKKLNPLLSNYAIEKFNEKLDLNIPPAKFYNNLPGHDLFL